MDPQNAKFLSEQLAGLWQGEFKATCEVLAAVPNEKRDYRPAAKSRSAWELAVHLATADVWFCDSIIAGQFNWNSDPGFAKQLEAMFPTVADLVAYYQKELPAKLDAVRALAPEKLAQETDFFGLMKMPAANFVGFANNHSLHHRGQLSAYLRSMGAKVPNIYGPSADAEPAA